MISIFSFGFMDRSLLLLLFSSIIIYVADFQERAAFYFIQRCVIFLVLRIFSRLITNSKICMERRQKMLLTCVQSTTVYDDILFSDFSFIPVGAGLFLVFISIL